MLFAYSPAPSYAQYSQANTCGNTYTYVNNYNPLCVTTNNATNITSSSATLNGLVNRNNLYNTYNLNTWFEYGTNTNFGFATVKSISNFGYANYTANVSGLSANTIYYFRAVAQNPQGIVYGNTNSFRTSFTSAINVSAENDYSLIPTIVTNPATSVSSRSAQLNSLITNPENDFANSWFEWGKTANLGNKTVVTSIGTLPSVFHADTLRRLSPGTTYYFRAVTENSLWRSIGPILNFTTNNVASQTSIVEKDTTNANTATTNLSSIQPAESALGANIIESNSFFPVNILGWFVLIILILILIILGQHLHRKFLSNTPDRTQEHM